MTGARTAAPLVLLTPPPTPNGRLHIGHVSGPYLRADLLRRLVAARGTRPVAHVSHLDTYQSYVPKKARQLGRDTSEFMAETGAGIVADFAAFGVDHDVFIDNASSEYLAFLDNAIESALRRLRPIDSPAVECGDCGSVLAESSVKGFCRNCLHDCFQNVCENCCIPQEYDTMLRPTCEMCGSTNGVHDESRQTQALQFTDADVRQVERIISSRHGGNRRIREMFAALGSHRLPLSYAADYGVRPTGIAGVLNPWVEIFFAHLYAILTVAEIPTDLGFDAAVAELNAREAQPEVVAFFGVDNSYYYAFLFPTLALRLGIPAMLPAALKPSFFLQLNNAKISSSRNNVIWAADIIDGRRTPAIRASLLASCPEYAAGDFREASGVSEPADPAGPGSSDWPAVAALEATLDRLTDPSRFSVEAISNLLEKSTAYAAQLSSRGEADEARAVRRLVRSVTATLLIE